MSKFSAELINKIGKRLAAGKASSEDIEILSDWRALHFYPLSAFQTVLRRQLAGAGCKNPTVAQRLKRLPTIIDKVKRFPEMKLGRMQDIGGLRAIVSSVDEVNRVAARSAQIRHKLKKVKNYLEAPKDSGYRGIHLVYEYEAKRAPDYSGILIEIQLRTRLQHLWATAVETVDFFFQTSLKTSTEKNDWFDFFKLVSAVFACEEKQLPQADFKHKTKKDLVELLKEFDQKHHRLHALETIRVTEIAKNKMLPQAACCVIETRFNGHSTAKVYPFLESQKDSADLIYQRLEQSEDCKSGKSQVVLVAVDSLKKLKKAYPNFFGDVGDFIAELKKIFSQKSF
jgi:hypothetical protein